MRDPLTHPVNDLERAMNARAQKAWTAMSDDVRFAMQKRLLLMNGTNAISALGTYYKDGVWSITPYPGAQGFGELGLVGCKYIHGKLCEQDT